MPCPGVGRGSVIRSTLTLGPSLNLSELPPLRPTIGEEGQIPQSTKRLSFSQTPFLEETICSQKYTQIQGHPTTDTVLPQSLLAKEVSVDYYLKSNADGLVFRSENQNIKCTDLLSKITSMLLGDYGHAGNNLPRGPSHHQANWRGWLSDIFWLPATPTNTDEATHLN